MVARLKGRYRAMCVLVSDLFPLADSDVDGASEHLRTMYDWSVAHGMTVVRITFGAAGALVLALVTAVLKNSAGPNAWQIAVLAGSAGALVGVGAFRMGRLATIHREFAAAQGLLAKLRGLHRLMYPPTP